MTRMSMRRMMLGLAILLYATGQVFAEDITSDTLTNEEVKPAIQPLLLEFFSLVGIFQEERHATIFYKRYPQVLRPSQLSYGN